jgi:hypothetical protein
MKPNQRHRTAISRTTLSRPLRLALESGLIDNAHPVLDYGCGRGDDLRELQARGIACEGWDPIHRPDGKRQETAVVNLGYIGAVEGANLIKLNRRSPKISYLAYPDFDRDPHPALVESLVVNLQTFEVRYYNYRESDSPPILHRKETFVPDDYPARATFERLTRQEERWGLYETPASIGRRDQWQQVLAAKGVRLAGHRIVRTAG